MSHFEEPHCRRRVVGVAEHEPVPCWAEGPCASLGLSPNREQLGGGVVAAERADYGLKMRRRRRKMMHHQSQRLVSRPEAPLKCPVRQENQAQL